MVRYGGSLVEILVAMVLCAIGLSASAATGIAALRLADRASASTRLVLRTGAVLDSLMTVTGPVAGISAAGTDTLRWLVAGAEARIVVTAVSGPSALVYSVRLPPRVPVVP
jgi:Tfp pilus assembly protein PilV